MTDREAVTSALALAQQISRLEARGEFTLDMQMAWQSAIREALLDGSSEADQVERALNLLKAAPAQKQVLILDTCHSGRVVEKLTEKRGVPGSQIRALDFVPCPA